MIFWWVRFFLDFVCFFISSFLRFEGRNLIKIFILGFRVLRFFSFYIVWLGFIYLCLFVVGESVYDDILNKVLIYEYNRI